MTDAPSERHSRQVRFAPIGEEGQRRLAAARVTLVGAGALGSVLANVLVRAGVGYLRLIDRDFLDLSNLQRQVLYDEADVASGLPKAIVAANKLRAIDSSVTIDPHVKDVDATNVEAFADGADLILDGTDNFEIRYLLNDVAVKRGVPWVFAGCLGASGQGMVVRPGQTPCLRCVLPDPPEAGAGETCDSAGILATAIQFVAAWQANEALKILSGNAAACSPVLFTFDLWDNRVHSMRVAHLLGQVDCPCCQRRQFDWLAGERTSHAAVLCGRNAVQLNFAGKANLSLADLAARLTPLGEVRSNP
jgi:adenylyltransferase/sulfurtransferase